MTLNGIENKARTQPTDCKKQYRRSKISKKGIEQHSSPTGHDAASEGVQDKRSLYTRRSRRKEGKTTSERREANSFLRHRQEVVSKVASSTQMAPRTFLLEVFWFLEGDCWWRSPVARSCFLLVHFIRFLPHYLSLGYFPDN